MEVVSEPDRLFGIADVFAHQAAPESGSNTVSKPRSDQPEPELWEFCMNADRGGKWREPRDFVGLQVGARGQAAEAGRLASSGVKQIANEIGCG